ncbi:restriction endonuclease subunit S [Streptomyces sp. MN3]
MTNPTAWETGTLDDVLEHVDVRNKDHAVELVLSVTEGRGIVPQSEVFNKRVATDDTRKYKVLQPLDIAWNPYLLWTGAIGQWRGARAGVTSPVYPVFRVREGQNASFWGMVLEGGVLTPYFNSRAIGTVVRRRRTTMPVFKEAPILIPPLPVQGRIVEVIGAVDDHIAKLEAEVEAVIKVRRGLVGRSEDTEQVSLGDLGVVSQGKGLPKQVQGKRTGEVPWYKIADMAGPRNKFGYTSADTRLTPSEVADIGGVVVKAGAVTFPRVGAAVLTEKKRILDTPGALDENHLVITPGEETNSEYLLAVIENFSLSSLVRSGAVPSLNMSLIRSTKVPWSWTENQSLGTALGTLRAQSRALVAEAASLRTTRAVLLSGLLDRTIDVESAELGV